MKRILPFQVGIGIKVAATVIFFEILLIATYAIVTNLIYGEESYARILNLDRQVLVTVVVVSTLVLAGYLTFLVITRIFNPVKALTVGTEEIMKGNLDMRLKISTGDELQVLAERFDAMAAALKAERESLENKVRERTRALEEAQKKEIERANEILKLKDEFLFVAAHELRTPVTAIRWSLESIAAKPMDPIVKRSFQDAMEAGANLATLVEDLLNMARLDAKRIPFKKEFVNLNEAANVVVKEIEPIASKRNVKVRIEVPEGHVPMALADERRVNEVLTNLASNAVKYNRDGGNVWIRMACDDAACMIDVADDGPGITPEERKHLFEKFWRAKSSTGVEGSGLGLFITKRLVEGMNGSIGFNSAKKQTTFSVKLPVAKA